MDNIFITSDGYVYINITEEAKKMTSIEIEMYEVWTDKNGIECHALIETMEDLKTALKDDPCVAIEIGTIGELSEKIDTFKRTHTLADGMLVEIINHEPQSVCFLVDGCHLWIDVVVYEEDVVCEWNKYIFHLLNSNDLRIRELQEMYMEEISSLAISFLEDVNVIHQDENGVWSEVKHPNLKK